MKPIPQTGFIPMPVSPVGFQPNPHHQFNTSMQVPPTYSQNNSLNSPPYQYSNQNASMTTVPGKYFGPPQNPVNYPQPVNYQPNFTKPVGPGYLIEQRSPNHQSFNSSLQQPVQGNLSVPSSNFAWKKT